MRITIESTVDATTAEAFLPIYHESFAHLIDLSAAKQSLSDEEYRFFMGSEDVLKFTGWTDDDQLCAVSLVTTRLDLVPWVSPPFFARRFPEHYERGVIYYFLTILVREQDRNRPWTKAILEAIGLHCGAVRGICVFDCCKFNDEVVGVPKIISEVSRPYLDFEEIEIDVQRYYAYVIDRIREIDLRNVEHRDVIDLRVHDRATPATSTVDPGAIT